MPRIYKVQFKAVTIANLQDLVQITGAAGRMMRILRMWLGPSGTLPTAQGISLRARLLPATITVGAGGTVVAAPSKNDPGDPACASTTCAINNTTPASTSGTANEVYANGVHIYQGENWVFPNPPPVGPGQAFVFELLANITGGGAPFSGGVEFAEEGG